MRKILLKTDYILYLIKWAITRFYCLFKLMALYVYHPFSSKWQLPYPNIIKELTK